MSSVTVRMSRETHGKLREIARKEHRPMQTLLDQAVEELSRRHFFEEADKAYAALRKDKKAWREHRKEMEAWDTAMMDGLERE